MLGITAPDTGVESRSAFANHADELPIANYNELNQSQAVATVKDLTEAAGIRPIVVYEEANKNRPRVVSAA
jgi:hypothetical protein